MSIVNELDSLPDDDEMEAMKVGAELEKLNTKKWYINWMSRTVKVGNQDMVLN